MKNGRFFTDIENQHRMPVVVVGEDVPRALLNGEDPMGKWIDVDGHKFEMIGVMLRPAASFPGKDDTRLLLPYFTMHKMFPGRQGEHARGHGQAGQLAAAMDEVARRDAHPAARSRRTSPTISPSPRPSRWWSSSTA